MIRKSGPVRSENKTLQAKYDLTALFYDLLDLDPLVVKNGSNIL
jgi:hypothetical protein